MAGMLYLPRLYVYHCKATPGSEMDETFKIMELKLLRMIINPAMIMAVIFGGTLAWLDAGLMGPHFWLSPWALTKIAALVVLFSWHGFLARARRDFANGRNQRSERFWRMTNEIPFVLAIIIVLSVTTKFGGIHS
ncbi:CopD family protein [Phenylobacterium montanum]|uniref:Protoporphyrinogen IX oxidase n=1 Tax=Phenylobacterium montanum TaxID=2823693 RepID=A0A975IYU1_9CAUL|nr:CopD family protein [Caulobacter sp. S6]QUD90811.1 CopD family protein [Caulobacter sp. S6]